jgi:hypothetical protein
VITDSKNVYSGGEGFFYQGFGVHIQFGTRREASVNMKVTIKNFKHSFWGNK